MIVSQIYPPKLVNEKYSSVSDDNEHQEGVGLVDLILFHFGIVVDEFLFSVCVISCVVLLEMLVYFINFKRS